MCEPVQFPKMNTRSRDLTGQGFGNLTAVGFAGFTLSEPRAAQWLCVCTCGSSRIVRASRLIKGKVTACATCANVAGQRQRGVDNRLPDHVTGSRLIYRQYKANAKRRELAFELSEFQFFELITASCAYCGQPPTAQVSLPRGETAFYYNGIDRKDNRDGYTVANVCTCCTTCNFAKREMSVSEFLGWVARVAAYRSLP